MSEAGTVVGSSYASGGLEPGGGLRYCGFKGMPEERLGSTARKRWMRDQMPRGWRVYF